MADELADPREHEDRNANFPHRKRSIEFERDERVAGIVANWSRGSTSERANALGLKADSSFEAIIEQYIADCKTRPGYPAEALNGLK